MIVLDQRYVTARKTHICGYCGRRIDAGERYEISKNVNDGSLYTWKSCAWHAAAARWIFMHWSWEYQDGLGQDDMMECLSELWGEADAYSRLGSGTTMPFDWTKE